MSTGTSAVRTRMPRFAEAAVERARLTVVPRRPQRAAKVPFVTLVSLLLVGGVVGLLLFNTSMQQASFAATAMQQQATVLDAREQSLQMELDTLRDPQKVATRAKQLGMVPAAGPAFLRLSDGKVLGNPEVAQADGGMRIAPLPPQKPKSLRPEPVIVKVDPTADGRAKKEHDSRAPGSDGGPADGTKKPRQTRAGQGTHR